MSNRRLLAGLGVCAALTTGAVGVAAGSADAQPLAHGTRPPASARPILGPLAMSPDPLSCLISTGSSAFCIG